MTASMPVATADAAVIGALSVLVLRLEALELTELAGQARNILAQMGFAVAPIENAILEFADELAAADGAEFTPAVIAGRLRNVVRGHW